MKLPFCVACGVLNARGVRTARDSEWTGVQVNNVLER